MSVPPLLLAGGEEWREGCEAFDRRLLEWAPDAPVSVLPTAAAAEGDPHAAVTWARRYFARLGAAVEGIMAVDRTGTDDPANAEAVRRARILYIGGGSPTYLYECLHGSAVWEAVLAARCDGLVLAGSSAGAMVLDASRLGLVAAAVLPHHEQSRRAPRSSQPALGIDARTALLWDGASWSVAGAGVVTPYGVPSVETLDTPAW